MERSEEELPKKWQQTVICPLLKKEDSKKCDNYQGIALLDVIYKIKERLQQKLEVYEVTKRILEETILL